MPVGAVQFPERHQRVAAAAAEMERAMHMETAMPWSRGLIKPDTPRVCPGMGDQGAHEAGRASGDMSSDRFVGIRSLLPEPREFLLRLRRSAASPRAGDHGTSFGADHPPAVERMRPV